MWDGGYAVSVTAPRLPGAGVAAGLKSTGAKDVALVVNDGPSYDSASVFTPTAAWPTPCSGARRSSRTASSARSCSTPAAPTATPAPTASRPPTPSPSASARTSGSVPIDVVVCSTGLIGLANDREQVLAGVDAAYDALGTARRGRRRPRDHDHRLRRQAGRGRGRRLVGRRHGQGRRDARAAARHDARRPDHRRRRLARPTSTPRSAPRPGSASTGSTPTAACRPTTPSPCSRAVPAGSRRACPT